MSEPRGAPRIDVRAFDPSAATPAEWAAYQRYRRLRSDEDLPGEPQLSDDDFAHSMQREWPFVHYQRVVAWCGDDAVGNLRLEYRREGTPDCERHAAFVSVGGGVLTPFRRQGIASRWLLPALHRFMTEQQRTTATFGGVADPAGCAFLTAIGATHKHRVIENRMAFAGLDWDELATWEAQLAGRHPTLRIERHAGRVPLDRLAPLMAPMSDMLNAMPLGALDIPPLRYDLAGYPSWYADMDRRGGEHFLVLVMDGDQLAAACDANWDARFPERMHQQLTGVAPAWRGQGLAKAVKAAMLRMVHARHPEVTTAITWNANVNAPMLSINERLGFAVHRQENAYQLAVGALGAVVGSAA